MTRTFSELSGLSTIEERYHYLRLDGRVADATFGFDRWINQAFYRSREWKLVRDEVIARDMGWDLGVYDVPIRGGIVIHHMNPLTLEDIEQSTENLLSPEFLISCALRTHNAVHYGDASQLPRPYVERRPGDTRVTNRDAFR